MVQNAGNVYKPCMMDILDPIAARYGHVFDDQLRRFDLVPCAANMLRLQETGKDPKTSFRLVLLDHDRQKESSRARRGATVTTSQKALFSR